LKKMLVAQLEEH